MRVHGFEERGNTAYMIMDFIEGDTLRDYVDRHRQAGTLTHDMMRDVLKPILDAIGYLHRENLVHRDISPDNIMITSDGTPMLIDFGALKSDLAAKSQSFSSVIVGRPSYSPPEQLRRIREDVGPYTDVFALAATMYECFRGEPPVNSDDRANTKSINDVDPYEPLSGVATLAAPMSVYKAFDKALELAPRRRTQSIEAFLTDLGWSDQAPVQADEGTAVFAPPPQPAAESGTVVIGGNGTSTGGVYAPQTVSSTASGAAAGPTEITPPPGPSGFSAPQPGPAPSGPLPSGSQPYPAQPGSSQPYPPYGQQQQAPKKNGALIPILLGVAMVVGVGAFLLFGNNGGGGTITTGGGGVQTSGGTQTGTQTGGATAGPAGVLSGLDGARTFCSSQAEFARNRDANARGPLIAYIERCEAVNGPFVSDARDALARR